MQPDLLVACDLEDNVTEKGRYMGTPTLVVEILSDSTRTKDLITKLNTYATSGVKEYWIIDQKQGMITIYSFKEYELKFRTPKSGVYRLYFSTTICIIMGFLSYSNMGS